MEIVPRYETGGVWRFVPDPILVELTRDIRTLEGALAIRGVRRIETREYSITWEPETPDEAAVCPNLTLTRKREDPRLHQSKTANYSDLVRNVISLDEIRHLEIPLQFNRRGRDAMRDDRYIEAIYQFYFFLESSFGNGKFKTSAVIEEFIAAPVLTNAIESARKSPHPEVAANPALLAEFNSEYASRTTGELVRLLVELRGFLHHHTARRTDIWNPGDQAAYKGDAYFWSEVCQDIAMTLVHKHSFSPQKTQELCSTIAFINGSRLIWRAE